MTGIPGVARPPHRRDPHLRHRQRWVHQHQVEGVLEGREDLPWPGEQHVGASDHVGGQQHAVHRQRHRATTAEGPQRPLHQARPAIFGADQHVGVRDVGVERGVLGEGMPPSRHHRLMEAPQPSGNHSRRLVGQQVQDEVGHLQGLDAAVGHQLHPDARGIGAGCQDRRHHRRHQSR